MGIWGIEGAAGRGRVAISAAFRGTPSVVHEIQPISTHAIIPFSSDVNDSPTNPSQSPRPWLPRALAQATGTRYTWIGWASVASLLLLILLPTLLHPLGTDQALFDLNGTLLLHGGTYYRDMVDMKPPLLSALYGLAHLLFPFGQHAIRALDILLQGLSCLLMIGLVRRAGGSDLLAAITAIAYALLYAGQRYGDMAQSEGYVGLFALPMLWFLLFRRDHSGRFLVGMMLGALWLLKFTFALLLLLPLLADLWLFRCRAQEVLRHGFATATGFLLIAGLLLLYVMAGDVQKEFLIITEFTRNYAATELHTPMQWLINLVTVLPRHLVLEFSPLLIAAIGIACAYGFIRRTGGSPPHDMLGVLIRASAIAFLLLVVTIIVEGKYPAYHFTRLFAPGAILAGAGLLMMVDAMAQRGATRRHKRGILAAGLSIVLLLGPFAYYGWHVVVPVTTQLLHGASSSDGLARYGAGVVQTEQLATYLAQRRAPGDALYAAASMGALIYGRTGFPPATNVHHFGFVNAVYGPQIWKDSAASYLLGTRPRFIVAEHGDSYPSTTGTVMTSEERLRSLPGIDSLLRAEYLRTLLLPNLTLYERRTTM